MDEHQSCEFDAKAPIDTWPTCANGWLIAPGAVIGPRERGAPRAAWVSSPTVLAASEPPVLQIKLDTPAGVLGPYIYAGVEVLKTDDQGRIIEMKSWPALCGPPPPPEPAGKTNPDGSKPIPTLTKALIPGLVADAAKTNCLAVDPGPVRVSARLSKAWGDANLSRWVRDGDR